MRESNTLENEKVNNDDLLLQPQDLDTTVQKKDSLKFNIILNFIYELVIILTPLFTAPYVSRVLGPEGVGTYSYVYSLVTYFSLFACLGTLNYGKKEIARRRKDKRDYSKTFWEIELITIFSSLISLIVWLVFSFSYTMYTNYMLVLSFVIISSMFDISWFFGGLEKFKFTICINSIVKIASIILIFIFVKSKDDLMNYFIILSISVSVGNISMWIFLPFLLTRAGISFDSLFKHLKNTLIYFLPSIAITVYTVLDKSLIGLLKNDNYENGYYEQATKIINLLKVISFSAVNGVMVSRASYLYSIDDKKELKKLTLTTYNINLFLTIGAIFGIISVAHLFVPIFFGDGYDPVIILIYIFSPILLIICVSTTIGNMYYVTSGKIHLSTYFIIAAAIINLILNLILIPNFGAKGAAIASVCAEIVTMILHIVFCGKLISFKDLGILIWRKIISGLIMFACIFMINMFIMQKIDNIYMLLIDILIGVVVYVLALLILRDKCIISLTTMIKEKFFRIKK